MYISGRRVQKPKKRFKAYRVLLVLFVVVVVLACVFWFLSRENISKDESDGSVRQTTFAEVPKQHITEPTFEFDLPSDWKEQRRKTSPYNVITWVGKARESIGRSLDVYVDNIPTNLHFNRLAPVSADGNHFVVGELTSNCINFTRDYANLKPVEAARIVPTKTKWEGIEFVCDVSNSLRNVIGTGSKEGPNQVKLEGEKGGAHRYFIVYTDHASHQDDKTFEDILGSFKAR